MCFGDSVTDLNPFAVPQMNMVLGFAIAGIEDPLSQKSVRAAYIIVVLLGH